MIVPVARQEDTVARLFQRVREAGEFGVVGVLLERVADELGKEAGLYRTNRGRVDSRADKKITEARISAIQELDEEEAGATHDLSKKKHAARGTHQRSSFLCQTRLTSVFLISVGFDEVVWCAGRSALKGALRERSEGMRALGWGKKRSGNADAGRAADSRRGTRCGARRRGREVESQCRKGENEVTKKTYESDLVGHRLDTVFSPVPMFRRSVSPSANLLLRAEEDPPVLRRHQFQQLTDLARKPLGTDIRCTQE
jgi:hypothetical protein